MRGLLTVTLVTTLLTGPAVAEAAPSRLQVTAQPAPTGGHVRGEGFDKCEAPSTADLRSWLGSPYRTVNMYVGGVNRHCKAQRELTPQWVSTVTSNGWSLIPTFVGLQPCTSSKPNHFTERNARDKGASAADNAVADVSALGIGAGNPIYFDMEPFNVSKDTCRRAAIKFVSAWTAELHAQGYVAGLYAHPTMGLKPLVSRTDPAPDAVWFPRYDGIASVSEPTLPGDLYRHHRIHQYRGSHVETYNGARFEIDNDAVDGDVVRSVAPARPAGPPYVYAASPPAGVTLNERSGPSSDTPLVTTYASGTALPIVCQAAGEDVGGSYVWDRLTDGNYVSDINTTTTGGLGFTRGIPRCDTAAPTATANPTKPATTAAGHTFSWSAVDVAPDGQATSGIGSYDVRYRRAAYNHGFGHWTHIDDLTTTQTRIPMDPGYDYCVEVRATDRSLNTGRWSDQVCIARALDDRALTADTRGWDRDTGKRFFLRTVTKTTRKHRELTLHGARLREVGVVATRCRGCGAIDVYVGKPTPHHFVGRVTLAGPRRDKAIVMLPRFGLTHKAVHLVTAHRGDKVYVDGLVVSRT